MFISIVLPVYNQADHIAQIVDEYQQSVQKIPYRHEFLLVVNGCHDNSLEICNQLEQQDPSSIRVVSSDLNGWGLAVRRGLKEAHGDILCYTNSARTTAEDLVLLILYGIANPESAVKAHRRSRESTNRKIGSFLYNLECRGLFDLPTWDINATPKVFTRKVYECLMLQRDDDLVDLEFYVECKRQNIAVIEVPIYHYNRHGGRSTTNYRSAVQLYLGAFRLWQQIRKRR